MEDFSANITGVSTMLLAEPEIIQGHTPQGNMPL